MTFGISQLPSPRKRATAGESDGQRAALVRRQLTPGLISSLPGTDELLPFISFSTRYPELDFAVTRNCKGVERSLRTVFVGEWRDRLVGFSRSARQSERTFEHDRSNFIATF